MNGVMQANFFKTPYWFKARPQRVAAAARKILFSTRFRDFFFIAETVSNIAF